MLGGGPLPFGVIVENEFLFFQAASQLPDGLTLADYQYRFYADNAGKEILTVDIQNLADGDTIVYDQALDAWKNGTGAITTGFTWGDLLGPVSTP